MTPTKLIPFKPLCDTRSRELIVHQPDEKKMSTNFWILTRRKLQEFGKKMVGAISGDFQMAFF